MGEIDKTIEFNESGDFQSYYKACEWLKENGYSYGSMERGEPIGLMKGDFNISKWRNLRPFEREKLDGIMTSRSFRESSVKITIYK